MFTHSSQDGIHRKPSMCNDTQHPEPQANGGVTPSGHAMSHTVQPTSCLQKSIPFHLILFHPLVAKWSHTCKGQRSMQKMGMSCVLWPHCVCDLWPLPCPFHWPAFHPGSRWVCPLFPVGFWNRMMMFWSSEYIKGGGGHGFSRYNFLYENDLWDVQFTFTNALFGYNSQKKIKCLHSISLMMSQVAYTRLAYLASVQLARIYYRKGVKRCIAAECSNTHKDGYSLSKDPQLSSG